MKIRSEPFLWIHLGGIVIFPLMWFVTLIGLGIGNKYYLIEIPLLIAIAILPVLLMQLYRPFNIFSLLFFSLQPESLTEDRRRILTLFKTQQQKLVSCIIAVFMLLSLGLLYYFAPLTADLSSALLQNRLFGLAIAIIAFFGSNLFLQVPLSALQVLFHNELASIEPCTVAEVEQKFTAPGIKLSHIPLLTKSSIKTQEPN